METYIGHIKTPQDALIIFEACRRGLLSRIQRRLSSKERTYIRSGAVFAWDEQEAGMRRWTDGRIWSPSRVLGSFLTYRELDSKHRAGQSSTSSLPSSSLSSLCKATPSCSYMCDGLIKQSFSICTAASQKLHIISYYTKDDLVSGRLSQPSTDPRFCSIVIPKGLYPDINPVDTSGGHSATIHRMREKASLSPPVPLNYPYHYEESNPPSPPHSLSSSSSFSPHSPNKDMLPMSSRYKHVFRPSNMYPFQATPPSFSGLTNSLIVPCIPSLVMSPSVSEPSVHKLLPIQEIAVSKLPSDEDRRQLTALQKQFRM